MMLAPINYRFLFALFKSAIVRNGCYLFHFKVVKLLLGSITGTPKDSLQCSAIPQRRLMQSNVHIWYGLTEFVKVKPAKPITECTRPL